MGTLLDQERFPISRLLLADNDGPTVADRHAAAVSRCCGEQRSDREEAAGVIRRRHVVSSCRQPSLGKEPSGRAGLARLRVSRDRAQAGDSATNQGLAGSSPSPVR